MNLPPAPRHTTLTMGLFIGILAASTAAIFIRFAQAEGVASIVIAAARLTIASFVLAPITLVKYRSTLRSIRSVDWIYAILSGIFLAFHFATWITSLEYTTIASSVVLVSTTPLWVALLSPLVLHERIRRTALLGMLLALTGGIIIGMSDACVWQQSKLHCPSIGVFLGGNAFLGDLLALCGAWMAAGYFLAGRRLRARLPLIPYIFIVYSMAALGLVCIMVLRRESPLGLSPAVYLWFILLALFPQLLGHSIFNWVLKYLPASFVAVTLLGEPIGSAIFAYFIFQETPGWLKMGGALILLIGIWLAGKSEVSQKSQE